MTSYCIYHILLYVFTCWFPRVASRTLPLYNAVLLLNKQLLREVYRGETRENTPSRYD